MWELLSLLWLFVLNCRISHQPSPGYEAVTTAITSNVPESKDAQYRPGGASRHSSDHIDSFRFRTFSSLGYLKQQRLLCSSLQISSSFFASRICHTTICSTTLQRSRHQDQISAASSYVRFRASTSTFLTFMASFDHGQMV